MRDQGKSEGAVGLSSSGLGLESLSVVVRLGCSFSIGTSDLCSPDVPQIPGEYFDLSSTPDHECRERGVELEDPDDQEGGLRLPESRSL